MGDFNACTSNLNDFIDLDNISHTDSNSYLPTNYSADLPLIRRQNMDTSINEQGKHLIDLCIQSKIKILNGRVMGDSLGSFTYYCTQGKSCIDYIVVSEDIVNSFNFLHVLPPNELSDHCIIWFSLKIQNSLDSITKCKQVDIYTYSIPGKFCVDV
jgi:exonuclease III